MAALKIGLLVMLAISCIFEERRSQQKLLPINDTILVAESHQLVAINKNARLQQVRLIKVNSFPVSGNKKFCLLFNDVQMQSAPEGVYEIYLNKRKEDSLALEPGSKLFVNVVDTYMLKEKKGEHSFCLDASGGIAVLAINNNLPPDFYVTVLFRGNLLPDKKEATNTGSLTIKGIQLMQIQ